MYQDSELTGEIIGLAMKVHTSLGPGFKENIYQEALFRDLVDSNYKVEFEKEFDVIYKGSIIGMFRVDLLVENKIIVETETQTASKPQSIASLTSLTTARHHPKMLALRSALTMALMVSFSSPPIAGTPASI